MVHPDVGLRLPNLLSLLAFFNIPTQTEPHILLPTEQVICAEHTTSTFLKIKSQNKSLHSLRTKNLQNALTYLCKNKAY
jgi:hypothetical protein